MFILTLVAGEAVTEAPLKQTSSSREIAEFNWAEMTPLDFLNLLVERTGTTVYIKYKNQPPTDWIKEEDVGRLMELIESKRVSAPVMSELSSYLPYSDSTVGNEAMFLIEGFRTGKYPPLMCSNYGFNESPDEYRRWWKERAGHDPMESVGFYNSEETSSHKEMLEDSKPASLSILDALTLRHDSFRVGHANVKVLVGILNNEVEYVWSNTNGRFVRPKHVMPNAQNLYSRWRRR
ncbi:MAG: hypothetical protein ABID09_05390 [Candidatus Omnitrophota bacterium]